VGDGQRSHRWLVGPVQPRLACRCAFGDDTRPSDGQTRSRWYVGITKQSSVALFAGECCVLDAAREEAAPSLHAAYVKWCDEKYKPNKESLFQERLMQSVPSLKVIEPDDDRLPVIYSGLYLTHAHRSH
jgi:hypothetical protein